MYRIDRLAVVLAVFGVIGSGQAAEAVPFSVTALLSVTGEPPVLVGPFDNVDDLGPVTLAAGKGTATAQIEDGAIRVFASALAIGVVGGTSSASAFARFTDTITFSQTGDLNISLVASYVFGPNTNCAAGLPRALARMQTNILIGSFLLDTGLDTNCPTTGAVNVELNGVLSGVAGESVVMQAQMNALAEAVPKITIPFANASTFADGLSTGRFFIDGAFTTASGNTYTRPSEAPVPVPEPSTLLLLGTGLVGAAVMARRRRKR